MGNIVPRVPDLRPKKFRIFLWEKLFFKEFGWGSFIQFKNTEGFVMLDKYISNLPLYVGTKYSYKKIGNDFFSIFMLSTFLYKSNKDWIEEIYLKVG